MSYPLNQEGYQQWVADNQDTECAVCYGTGWAVQENPSGIPTHEVTCPYCHGRGTQGWVPERREARFDFWDKWRKPLIIATIGLVVLLTLSVQSAPLGLVAWFVVIGWPLYLIKRRPKYEKPGYTPRHAPGFTDDRERNALGLFGAGVVARGYLGQLFKDLKK